MLLSSCPQTNESTTNNLISPEFSQLSPHGVHTSRLADNHAWLQLQGAGLVVSFPLALSHQLECLNLPAGMGPCRSSEVRRLLFLVESAWDLAWHFNPSPPSSLMPFNPFACHPTSASVRNANYASGPATTTALAQFPEYGALNAERLRMRVIGSDQLQDSHSEKGEAAPG